MRRTILLVSAITLVLTACSPSNNGTPNPTTGAANSSSANPASDVPRVQNSIDLARFKQAPCNSLSDLQAEELLGAPTDHKARDGNAGPACMWSIPSSSRPTVDVIFGRSPDGGTAKVYEAKGKAYELVEPIEPIDGYPLTIYDTKDERTSKGRCSVALGTSDTETVSISLEQSEANIGHKDPCDAARQAAVRVLATIRGGN
ncbi:DUF3558 domain-containing protein [Amycolatopsis alba]|uniref:DUF3558 domain-containing protein n=1 Tax=Amycolatopsis alba DSM 44262 TaxID=1125972 RepID=A0A229R9H9_AMYAL|nr:DUF3558 domain-containing protein [Amycolatopsis alba]OXM43322.1 DUF3558 domain-containing protein [Amycolatopsis alba DSM 44262]